MSLDVIVADRQVICCRQTFLFRTVFRIRLHVLAKNVTGNRRDHFVGRYAAKGLAYIKVNDVDAGRDGLQSPILKFLPDEAVTGIVERTGAKTGDLIFFGADKDASGGDAGR